MCSAEGSAHVPTFSKKKILFTFLQSLMLKSVTGNMGGTEFSHIFPPQYWEMQLPAATYCHCTAACRVPVIDTITNLCLNWRTVWNISDGQELAYFPLQGKTVKKPLFLCQTGKDS